AEEMSPIVARLRLSDEWRDGRPDPLDEVRGNGLFVGGRLRRLCEPRGLAQVLFEPISGVLSGLDDTRHRLAPGFKEAAVGGRVIKSRGARLLPSADAISEAQLALRTVEIAPTPRLPLSDPWHRVPSPSPSGSRLVRLQPLPLAAAPLPRWLRCRRAPSRSPLQPCSRST